MFSRNSASSRAIPFDRMVKAVTDDPFIPLRWMKDHKGMQGNEYLDEVASNKAENAWRSARLGALANASYLYDICGVTKQMCNRLLEPWMWTTVLCTATEWENFFAQRANDGADIHMQALAYAMLNVMNASTPEKIKVGDWHIPYRNQFLGSSSWNDFCHDHNIVYWDQAQPLAVKVSVAMAARTSYTMVGEEKKQDYVADIALHDKLWAYPHPSPFEHCSQCPTEQEYELSIRGTLKWTDGMYAKPLPTEGSKGWFGNFHGWKQYRKMLENENQSDTRLLKKS